MTIKKIISSGALGAESAALDIAIRLKIPYGGYAISSPVLEIERRRHRYRLTRKPFQDPQSKDAANLQTAEGTLIFSHGILTDFLDYIQTYSRTRNPACTSILLSHHP